MAKDITKLQRNAVCQKVYINIYIHLYNLQTDTGLNLTRTLIDGIYNYDIVAASFWGISMISITVRYLSTWGKWHHQIWKGKSDSNVLLDYIRYCMDAFCWHFKEWKRCKCLLCYIGYLTDALCQQVSISRGQNDTDNISSYWIKEKVTTASPRTLQNILCNIDSVSFSLFFFFLGGGVAFFTRTKIINPLYRQC